MFSWDYEKKFMNSQIDSHGNGTQRIFSRRSKRTVKRDQVNFMSIAKCIITCFIWQKTNDNGQSTEYEYESRRFKSQRYIFAVDPQWISSINITIPFRVYPQKGKLYESNFLSLSLLLSFSLNALPEPLLNYNIMRWK